MLCNVCEKIKLLEDGVEEVICRYRNVETIEESAQQGCRLCHEMMASRGGDIITYEYNVNKSRTRRKKGLIRMLWQFDEHDRNNLVGWLLDGEFIAYDFYEKPLLVQTLVEREESLVKDGRFLGTNQYYNPSTVQCLELARKWVESSIAADDTESGDKYSPSRVVDISLKDQSRVGLHSTLPGERLRYAALTYCWGKGYQVKTLKSNLDAHRKGIPLKSLPTSTKDAILVARALNFRYIWIDALCIVQDDNDDWLRESHVMNSIYSAATLTIAADSVDCVSKSWLGNRIESGPKRIWDAGSGKGRYMISNLPPLWHDEIYTTPLGGRGWTLQERLLSRRVLHFGKHEIVFEDLLGVETETRALSGKSKIKLPSLLATHAKDEKAGGQSLMSLQEYRVRTKSIPELLYVWYCCLHDYTSRKLGRRTDKMVALLGIARDLGERMGLLQKGNTLLDILLAGNWKHDFVAGLCWNYATYGPLPDETKLEKMHAPSWSWLSMDEPLAFWTRRPIDDRPILWYTTLVEANITVLTDYTFSGSVIVDTMMKCIGANYQEVHDWLIKDDKKFYFDDRYPRDSVGQIFVALLFFEKGRDPRRDGSLSFLFLRETAIVGTFERIGALPRHYVEDSAELMDGLEARRIRLV